MPEQSGAPFPVEWTDLTRYVVVLTDSSMLLIPADRHRRLDDLEVFDAWLPGNGAPDEGRWEEVTVLRAEDVVRVERLTLRHWDLDDNHGCG